MGRIYWTESRKTPTIKKRRGNIFMAKFNEEICKELIIAHENGLPRNACASIVGINRRTLYDWLKKGEKAKTGKYHDFYLRWLKAEARFQAYHLKKINDSKSWAASQYLLQVTDPETYVVAEKQEMEANINAEANLNADVDLTSPEFMNRELELMKKIIRDKE